METHEANETGHRIRSIRHGLFKRLRELILLHGFDLFNQQASQQQEFI
jgi:hypothetical protein